MEMGKPRVRSFVIEEGVVTCLYADEDRKILGKVGRTTKAEKISDVRFNAKAQKWEAVDRKTRKVIATHVTRAGCVRGEHDYYEELISRGVIPWER